MAEIHILPPVLANRIAAGEVVERPASIVKELVENAIDAGADNISVTITDGGISSIIVTDNGCGIDKEQCSNAFLRHATSKISTTEDLSQIESLGFRGEALASICAVSSVTITTRTNDSDTGITMRIDSGEIIFEREIVCPIGTTLKVENLFAKVPARLRFLKSSRYEAGYCGDYISRMILAKPDISFHYVQDGKSVYETFGDGSLKNAIYAVYGAQTYSHLREVCFDDGYVSIYGFVGTQELSFQNKSHQSFFTNGRYIKSSPLSGAVETAYLTKIMAGKYPFAVLNLKISPREIDVNVHPAKTQIRFANENRVCNAVTSACSKALKESLIPSMRLTPETYQPETSNNSVSVDKTESDPEILHAVFPLIEKKEPKNKHEYRDWMKELGISKEKSRFSDSSEYNYNDFQEKMSGSAVPQVITQTNIIKAPQQNAEDTRVIPLFAQKANQESLPIPAEYKIIGCAYNAYWIVEYEQKLYIIDQHAACERRLYEKLMADEVKVSSQELLSPDIIPLQPIELSIIQKYRSELEKIGFQFSEEGILQVMVSAVPVINGVVFPSSFITEASEDLSSMSGEIDASSFVYEKLVSASCKHAIKAGERITTEEIKSLISYYNNDGTPLTCPHGRPVVISISKQEIEKNFKRIV